MENNMEYKIFKPNTKFTGAVVQLNISEKSDVFALFAKQTQTKDESGNFRFDYNKENTISMKLESIDLASIVAVIEGRKNSINNDKGLFHQFESAGVSTSKTLKFNKNDPKYGGYYMTVFQKKPDKQINVNCPISDEEAIVLREFCITAIKRKFAKEDIKKGNQNG